MQPLDIQARQPMLSRGQIRRARALWKARLTTEMTFRQSRAALIVPPDSPLAGVSSSLIRQDLPAVYCDRFCFCPKEYNLKLFLIRLDSA